MPLPNKDTVRIQTSDGKNITANATQNTSIVKSAVMASKTTVNKPSQKESPMSPTASLLEERPELLGSLTTQQQQRTSARVIKKLRLEPVGDKRGKRPDGSDEIADCDTPKLDEKELKFPTVKQRMPKALWSADEKSLFFEALNEYGKDFDAITAHICTKMKKKGMLDNLKTKTQVSHFYYRTWHKLSKHVHFDDRVKKVAQELYALINYGELRKRLVSVNEKTCGRLGELVQCGGIAVRARGRNLRVRTPMCRALRTLNQINERACGLRVCSVAHVVLRARCSGSWARVQSAAHNPRAAVLTPLPTKLQQLIHALQTKWGRYKQSKLDAICRLEELLQDEGDTKTLEEKEDRVDLEEHLNMEPERVIVQEHKLPKKPVLHVGPRPDADIHLPVISPCEQLSSQKICFNSYLERIASLRRDKDGSGEVKIRTPKRQRKDSTTDKEKDIEHKKIKLEDADLKLMHIEETAIDGIELMAHFKSNQEDDEKPSTEDEKEAKEETGEEEVERDKDMSEREKDSFSEMEDDEKYNKSDSDNDSDGGKKAKERKFKNLKVKFRIRPKKQGGSIYTMLMDKDKYIEDHKIKEQDEPKIDDKEEQKIDEKEEQKVEEKEEHKIEEKEEQRMEEEPKPDFDVEFAMKQVRKGWSVYDAGDLTIGDLYLMFGSRRKLELDYWWAEPTPPLPLPQRPHKHSETDKSPPIDKTNDKKDKTTIDKKDNKTPLEKIKDDKTTIDKKDKNDKTQPEKIKDKCDKVTIDKVLERKDKTPDKGNDSSVEEDREKSDSDMFSPKNTYSQDSNDGMSGDERKSEQLASPDHKSSTTLKLVSKLINRPTPAPPNNGFSQLSDRLKRLLALAGNTHVPASGARCACGHVCAQQKKQKPQASGQCLPPAMTSQDARAGDKVFRQPIPIAPRPVIEQSKSLSLSGLPRWRRGRPRAAERRVVVQRLLPLLPKLSPPGNLLPVKLVASAAPPPRLLPRPPPSAADLSVFYVLSESNGQFYFHDGDRKVPIGPLRDTKEQDIEDESIKVEGSESHDDEKADIVHKDAPGNSAADNKTNNATEKAENPDIANFLPSESLSLSPSRLLHEGWLDGAAHDFSLSSFLAQLEGRPQPDLAVDSQLQSLLAESSVDYVAKFADLAAEVAGDAPAGDTGPAGDALG